MLNLVTGPNGSGKTQKLIGYANAALESSNGLIAYIDKSDKHRLAIANNIKFINASEFPLSGVELFEGFVLGLMTGNYDLNEIYIDNIMKITKIEDTEELTKILEVLTGIARKYEVKLTLTLDSDVAEKIKSESFNIKQI